MGHGHGHFVERGGERAKLVVAHIAYAVGKISGLHSLGGAVKLVHGVRDGAGHHRAGDQRPDFDHQEHSAHTHEDEKGKAAEIPEGREQNMIQPGGARVE